VQSSHSIEGLDKAQMIAQSVAESTSKSAQKLAIHKQQVRNRQKSKEKNVNHKVTNQIIISTDGDNMTSGREEQVMVAASNVLPALSGLDKAIHTAEMVALSTEESLDKLSKSLNKTSI
jgi:hypothetical protein